MIALVFQVEHLQGGAPKNFVPRAGGAPKILGVHEQRSPPPGRKLCHFPLQ